jgi:hypothetical protein
VNLFFIAVCKYAGKDFSHLQRAKSTGGFFDRGVIGDGGGGGIILANKSALTKKRTYKLFELIIQISLQ